MMKTLTPLLTATAGVVSTSVVLAMTPVFASTFQTTLTLDSPGGTPFIDTIVFEWSTDLTSGMVTEADLTNWSYELFGSGSSVYSETVVLDSVVQPIGGVSRSIGDIPFDFDLDTLTLANFDNDFDVVQEDAATGVTYNIFTDPIFVRRYVDGIEIEDSINFSSFSQETVEIAAESVPEPGSVMALLGLGLGVLATQRTKQA